MQRVWRHLGLGAQGCMRADKLLMSFEWGRRNTVRLVWGSDMPPAA